MMDPKLRKAIEAALDAADAVYAAVYGDSTWGETLPLIEHQHKAIKAARRELAKANQDESRG